MEAKNRYWIRNPLACFTATAESAEGGLVICGGIIEEVLAKGQQPAAPVDSTFDAREHVLLPGLVNTHHWV